MKRLSKPLILFLIGGALYIVIELMWRGRSHWTMFFLGGICFLYAGMQNEYTEWDKPLTFQSVQAALFITATEFITGCIVNLWLGWHVWDYSELPFNLLGQICLPFSILWIFVGTAAIILDDYLRYWIFDEEKPHYNIFINKSMQ